jgi:prophage tail gpP-like protein
MDTFDSVSFSAPFNERDAAFRETFRPFSYKPVDVSVSSEPLFTGTMVVPNPILEDNRRAVDVSCYALPAVLNDCTLPASAFPLEYNGQGLQDIAVNVAAMFGLAVEFNGQQGAVFERVAAEESKKGYQFLMELARQRNYVISNTPSGALLFQRSVSPGSPVAILEQGVAPVGAVLPQFNAQAYYSHITGLQPAVIGLPGAQFTVENPRLKGHIRPLTFKADDTNGADVKAAVEAKIGRMFANAVSYPVPVSTWRDPQGSLWRPNTSVTLLAPGAMAYSAYEFIIRSVEFSRDSNSEGAVLNLVLPGSFEGKVPETLPWD